MYQFKWPLCKKIALLVVVCCYKAGGDTERDLWMYWLPECCVKQPMGDGCLSKVCELGEEWSIDIAASGTLAKCYDVQYGNTRFQNISD